MSTIKQIISDKFDSISLKEMDCVELMNRIDTKYIVEKSLLEKIFSEISSQYFILEIGNQRSFPYISLYWDTIDNKMYLAHHNGRLDRYKIRFRKYIESDLTFLEIKHKIKGTRTIKKRTKVDDIETTLSSKSIDFIEKNSPFSASSLRPVIYTDFTRITLVNKDFTERATIDTSLTFHCNCVDKHTFLNSTIIELKRDGNVGRTLLTETLSKYGVYPKGMSKYCLGRVVIDTDIKKNNFKEKILQLNKIENGKFYYRNLSNTCD